MEYKNFLVEIRFKSERNIFKNLENLEYLRFSIEIFSFDKDQFAREDSSRCYVLIKFDFYPRICSFGYKLC